MKETRSKGLSDYASINMQFIIRFFSDGYIDEHWLKYHWYG